MLVSYVVICGRCEKRKYRERGRKGTLLLLPRGSSDQLAAGEGEGREGDQNGHPYYFTATTDFVPFRSFVPKVGRTNPPDQPSCAIRDQPATFSCLLSFLIPPAIGHPVIGGPYRTGYCLLTRLLQTPFGFQIPPSSILMPTYVRMSVRSFCSITWYLPPSLWRGRKEEGWKQMCAMCVFFSSPPTDPIPKLSDTSLLSIALSSAFGGKCTPKLLHYCWGPFALVQYNTSSEERQKTKKI